jgi:hypothetical protein
MIDDLQTPKHKTNHKYRSYFPLLSFIVEIKPTIKSKQRYRKKVLPESSTILKIGKKVKNAVVFSQWENWFLCGKIGLLFTFHVFN